MRAPLAPKRLIVFFTHYGCLTNRWFPAKSHGPLTRDDYAELRTLAPLAPYANKLLMVRGIRAMNEWSFEGTLGQKNDPHSQVCGSFFTCHPVTPNATTASGSTSYRKFDAEADRAIAGPRLRRAGQPERRPPLFLQIGGVAQPDNSHSVISWSQAGAELSGLRDAEAGSSAS